MHWQEASVPPKVGIFLNDQVMLFLTLSFYLFLSRVISSSMLDLARLLSIYWDKPGRFGVARVECNFFLLQF